MEKEHAFKIFNNNLKEDNFKRVMLFYGEEDYLKKWAVDSLINKYINESSKSMDLVRLFEDATSQEIIESCETFSMFSNNRVVIVKDFPLLKNENSKGYTNSDIDLLISYFENANDGTFLVFESNEINEKNELYKSVLKYGEVYNFTKLDEPTLISFASKCFKENGVVLDKSLLKYFIDQTGYFYKESDYKLYNIINDVTKISSYSNNGVVTKNEIDTVLVGEMDTFVFNFLDAISNNKKDKAFEMLHSILRESDIFPIVGILINQFELMLFTCELKKSGLSLPEIVSKLHVHEYRVKKAIQASDRFEINDLKYILSKLYEIDRNIKTGVLDGEIALDLIIAEM